MDPESKELGTVLPHMPDRTPSLVRFDWAKQCTLKEMGEKLKSCEVKLSLSLSLSLFQKKVSFGKVPGARVFSKIVF